MARVQEQDIGMVNFIQSGYIVSDNTVPNYDTTAREVDQYLGRTNTLSNKQLSDVARFNAGYNKPKLGNKTRYR